MILMPHPFAKANPSYRTVYAIGEGKYQGSIVNIDNFKVDDDNTITFTVDLIELVINGNPVTDDIILVNAAFAELKTDVCKTVEETLVKQAQQLK